MERLLRDKTIQELSFETKKVYRKASPAALAYMTRVSGEPAAQKIRQDAHTFLSTAQKWIDRLGLRRKLQPKISSNNSQETSELRHNGHVQTQLAKVLSQETVTNNGHSPSSFYFVEHPHGLDFRVTQAYAWELKTQADVLSLGPFVIRVRNGVAEILGPNGYSYLRKHTLGFGERAIPGFRERLVALNAWEAENRKEGQGSNKK